jgi:hypothetical protein
MDSLQRFKRWVLINYSKLKNNINVNRINIIAFIKNMSSTIDDN